MPKADHRVNVTKTFSEVEQVLLRVLLEEVNLVREAQGLPVTTPEAFRQRVHQALATVRRERTVQARDGMSQRPMVDTSPQ